MTKLLIKYLLSRKIMRKTRHLLEIVPLQCSRLDVYHRHKQLSLFMLSLLLIAIKAAKLREFIALLVELL
jgi:hypothetical protein